MRTPLVAVPLLIASLTGLLAWRVHAQGARSHAPSGGSATIEGTAAIVGARIAGRVTDVLVREGERVVRGQAVARIDCAEPEAARDLARARVRSADAQLLVLQASIGGAEVAASASRAQAAAASAQARVVDVERTRTAEDARRAEQLLVTGAISQVEVEHTGARLRGASAQVAVAEANGRAAELGSHGAEANVRIAKANLDVARAAADAARAEERRAEIAVSECTLVAPSDGTVTGRLVEPGAIVGPGSRLVTLIALTRARATFFLPNAELARARPGGAAEVRVDAYPGRVFHGKVARIADEAEFTPRNVQTREDRDRLVYAVEIDIDNADGALRAGMPAEIALEGDGAMTGEPLLEARNVARAFGRVRALAGVSVALRAGELVGLIGPDGAGKTTLVRAMTGLLVLDDGEARVDGVPWARAPRRARERLGYMPQHYGLYGDLSVDENLRFFARLFGVAARDFAERRARLLDLTQLTAAADRPAGALSGGMYKKLAVACALLHRPSALVLDEPTNGVDPVSRRELWELLYELVASGIGVLVSTPYMDEAARCSRVALLAAGRVIAEGEPTALVAAFEHDVVYATGEAALEAALTASPHVRAITPGSGRLRVVVERGYVAAVAEIARAHGGGVTPSRADFEDVYLARASTRAELPS